MGSGEADAAKFNEVNYVTITSPFTFPNITTTTNSTWVDYSYYKYIYLYQITCPKRNCKQSNWLQLDIITPCTKCGAKLKAVEEQPDFTVAVKK